ncbi:MAG TPA: hypothetical protein VFH51_09245, partial [Myxococcota bacterium]|nr:hypothetical protein [Myxococcota bacterium]
GQLCIIPTLNHCLTLNVYGLPLNASPEDRRVICTENTQRSQREIFGDRCFLEWQLYAECAIKQQDRCPCDGDGGNYCAFTPEVQYFGPGCEAQAAALAKCGVATGGSGKETGSAGTYEWADGEFGCTVQGLAKNGVDMIQTWCQGPLGGPQACSCKVNGRQVVDDVRAQNGGDGPLYADDCRDVANQLSEGRCADILDCCYEYDSATCRCGNPALVGVKSCAEWASSLKATQVPICDALRPPSTP